MLAFETMYRGSEEERRDVLALYARFGGDMAKVYSYAMCSYPQHDDHRFADMVEAAVAEGAAPASKTFEAWAKKARRRPRPADDLAPPPPELQGAGKKRKSGGGGGEEGQTALIAQLRGQRKQSSYGAAFAAIEAKYGKAEAEPSEEEFEAARQRMEARRAQGPVAAAAAPANGGGKAKKAAPGGGKGKKAAR